MPIRLREARDLARAYGGDFRKEGDLYVSNALSNTDARKLTAALRQAGATEVTDASTSNDEDTAWVYLTL